jgi:hypothetical protein
MNCISRLPRMHQHSQIQQSIRIPPFIIIPGNYLEKLSPTIIVKSAYKATYPVKTKNVYTRHVG